VDLGRLKEIKPWCFSLTQLPGEERAPVRLYANAELLRGMDAKVLEQIANVARLHSVETACVQHLS
jgi:tRNA-splicing ligase RtcB